jgi:hypothetical protein
MESSYVYQSPIQNKARAVLGLRRGGNTSPFSCSGGEEKMIKEEVF